MFAINYRSHVQKIALSDMVGYGPDMELTSRHPLKMKIAKVIGDGLSIPSAFLANSISAHNFPANIPIFHVIKKFSL